MDRGLVQVTLSTVSETFSCFYHLDKMNGDGRVNGWMSWFQRSGSGLHSRAEQEITRNFIVLQRRSKVARRQHDGHSLPLQLGFGWLGVNWTNWLAT
jgi:hypothetical protein